MFQLTIYFNNASFVAGRLNLFHEMDILLDSYHRRMNNKVLNILNFAMNSTDISLYLDLLSELGDDLKTNLEMCTPTFEIDIEQDEEEENH